MTADSRSSSVPPTTPEGKRTRLVVIGDEYLDGIMALHVSKPDTWVETAWLVDVDALDAYEAAQEALQQAEDRLRKAWASAPEVPNPSYEPDDEDEADDDV